MVDYWERNINIVYNLGFMVIAISLGVLVFLETGQDVNSLLLAIYVAVLLGLTGLFVVFPGGARSENEWGDKVRVGNINNLSNRQVLILLLWFDCFGAYLIYRLEFGNSLYL